MSSVADLPVQRSLKILAIRFARLGDIILLLPALSALKSSFPDSHLTFVTGAPCAPVGHMCPSVDEVLAVDRLAMRDGPVLDAVFAMKQLVGDLRRRRFDLVIDFHSFRETNLLAWLSGAPKRLGMKRYQAGYLPFCFNMSPVIEDKSIHVIDMFLRVARTLGDGAPASRNLIIPEDARIWAARVAPGHDRVCIFVDSSGSDKTWPAERFAQVADFAVEKLGASVMVLSGKEGDTAELVKRAARHAPRIHVFGNLELTRMAALIASARLLVSNDTGPMHFGPALGVPTLGLFSVGLPEHFRPTGPDDRFFRENPIEEISAQAVMEAAGQMWTKTADRDLPR